MGSEELGNFQQFLCQK